MKVGDLAQDFELYSENGDSFRLSSHIGKKKIILVFYVKDHTPGCTLEVNGIRECYSNLSDRYEIIGINHGSIKSHKKFSQKNNLPFQLLSDLGKNVAAKYDAKSIFGMFTKRMTILIGLDGKIEKIVEGIGSSQHIEFIASLSKSNNSV